MNAVFKQRGLMGLLISCLFWFSTSVLADTQSVVVLKESAQQMISMLKANQNKLHNQSFLHAQVRKIVVPRFDLTTMAQSVVGRNHWTRATPAEREQFIRQFTSLVISVYAAPLADYNGDKVQFMPQRAESGSRSVVHTQIIRPTGQKIAVVYQMLQSGGSWKVYDFSIEGISMVSSYRAQFAEVLQSKGMPGLLAELRQHNRSVS